MGLSENIKKMTLSLNFGNREKFVPTRKPTQKFEFKFEMQGLTKWDFFSFSFVTSGVKISLVLQNIFCYAPFFWSEEVIFVSGIDLPVFGSFTVLKTEDGTALLKKYFRKFAQVKMKFNRVLWNLIQILLHY